MLPEANLHQVPDTVQRLGAVLGPGAMGQVSAQIARVQGGRVTLAGLAHDAHRLQVAADLGLGTLAGQVDLGPLVTGSYPLERWDQALQAVRTGAGIKTVLVPG